MRTPTAILALIATMACSVLTAATEQITVYVVGQVNKPGTYQLSPGYEASSAIAKAGGTTDEADPAQIHILRHKPDSTSKTDYDVIVFNLEAFSNTGKGDQTLQEHDIINVPAAQRLNRTGAPSSVPTAIQPANKEFRGIDQQSYTNGDDFIME